MKAQGCALALGLVIFCVSSAGEPSVGQLELVRYEELTEIIKLQKGKLVLVDFWGDFCLPCKREFPKFLKVHEKFASKGLVAMSVSLDNPADEDTKQRVEKFLKAQKATTRNFMLNEKTEYWQKKLKMDGPPCIFLFDRQGKLVHRWTDEVNYGEIEKRVEELVEQER